MSRLALAAITTVLLTACSPTSESPSGGASSGNAPVTIARAAEVRWEQLNPARGAASPRAATLWGDRTGPGPAGFLLKPVDGFRSPPHIHGVAYRGVVISGLLHNDDPAAEDMWMGVGSFWTQPAGGIHITAAQGDDSLAYIEVEDAFGVLPAAQAFEDAERPVNVDASNVVWVDPPATSATADGVKVAYLWGLHEGDGLRGLFVRLPGGGDATLGSRGSTFQAVVIQGRPRHGDPSGAEALEPGSLFRADGAATHRLSCEAGADCVVYIRTNGEVDVQ
ncbi:MAG: DUF4437 domain-containing protein [Acidobacteriota bacterium]